ncbi:8313_t:CDS:1, partial [Dentiscutata erythropus]
WNETNKHIKKQFDDADRQQQDEEIEDADRQQDEETDGTLQIHPEAVYICR